VKKQLFDFAKNTLKNSFMSEQNVERSKHAETVIRTHTLAAAAAGGFVRLPVADILAIGAVQLDMIRQLCRVYNIEFAEAQGKAVVSSITSATLGKAVAGSAIKFIPILNLVSAIPNAIFAGASTYAVGEVFKIHFERGGTILDFEMERAKKLYKEKFEKGKKVTEEWAKEEKIRKKTTAESTDVPQEAKPNEAAAPVAEKAPQPNGQEILAKLKELAEMRDSGVLSEEEFATMKKKLIDMFG
jgi:uncharacterized protein (DUF697 family)